MTKQYTRTESRLKIMPNISPEERLFIMEMISGSGYADAWQRAFDKEGTAVDPATGEKLTFQQRQTRGRAKLKLRRVKKWMAYLETATPEELVEDLYVQQIAFGETKNAMNAANAFLESQFAGKEVAEIFIRTLQQIHAEIVVPCQGRAETIVL